MPLLKRKAFEKSSVSEYLRDDDEVFHCEVTDEIFKDYEEYCERIILVNSMVWTCEMTGKNNLTYAEALESEKEAKKSLKDFPMELRIPILILASRTNRCSFAEMSEDVFNYVRERFFIGEEVEACLEGDSWREAHILSVTAQKQKPGSKEMLPASSYCYEVEQYDEANPSEAGQIGTAPHDRVRRRKGVYTRDKSRLFLKQFVEGSPGGVIRIKKQALEKYNIHKVTFDQLFTGSPPEFPSSKKLIKSPSTIKPPGKPGSATKAKSTKKPTPDKKGRQESMDKFVKKTDKAEAPKPKPPVDPQAKKNAQELAEKMRRAEEAMRQKKEDERVRKKEKAARLQAYLKEWQRVKDDLELEDHKVIPKGTPIEIEGISQSQFGDFLSVLEFIHVYSDVLKVKDVFHNDLDVEALRKALTLKEHAGTFSDIIQMFLTTIFSLQEDEAEEYNEDGGIQESTSDPELESVTGVTRAVELATKASKWSQTYLGTPLSKLPLDPTTVSEVLRLHLLSSGAAPGGRCATWRYHQRGGYSSADDAGLQLRARRPDLLRALHTAHVADLPLDDKLQVLQCLMNQVLSYATVRDMIEEKNDDLKNTRQALRLLQVNERKRQAQLVAARQDLKKEFAAKREEEKPTGDRAAALTEEMEAALENLRKESEQKRLEYEQKLEELQTHLFNYTSYLGCDRAYRRYWVNQKVAGVFVEAGGEARGPCRLRPVPPPPGAPGAAAAAPDTLAYVARLYEQRETASSDKENESGSNSRDGSPKKPLAHLNGLSHKPAAEGEERRLRELLVCTGDPASCHVHGKGEFRPQWWVYHTAEQLEGLIAALNRRGVREAELRHALEADRPRLLRYVARCPVHLLHRAPGAPSPAPAVTTRRSRPQPSLVVPEGSALRETLELSLRDHILELEEKIFHGCLGALKVEDREAWRGTIMLRGYDKQAEHLAWGPRRCYRDDYHQPDGVLRLPTDADTEDVKAIPANKYRDPGHYLEPPKVNGVRPLQPGEAGGEAGAAAAQPDAVRGLACALLQLAQAVHPKYLKRPLGLDEKERKEREAKNKPLDLEALERWEVSLMECRSAAQVVLHLLALDSSVTWSASILNASCRLCRRKADPDNMLLCDGCNKGHHLYCLKPKLNKVPEGDWFCQQCKPKERAPRKRRKLFSDEDIKEALDDSGSGSEVSVDLALCAACGSGGELRAECAACGARHHAECAPPPRGARAARRWLCAACRPGAAAATTAAHREHAVRRCAAAAILNIQQYARALSSRRDSTESEDSEDNVALGKLRGRGSSSAEPEPRGSPPAKRGRKPKVNGEASGGRKSRSSLTNGVHDDARKSGGGRRRGVRSETEAEAEAEPEAGALQVERAEALLRDVMRHKDCWPFYEPVSTTDVPDYLDVIARPMDFSTVRARAARGEYATARRLLADVALVFANCHTYNRETHPVAKAGVRLERYVNKRCQELGLPPLPELDAQSSSSSGKRRSPSGERDPPKAKREKLK